MAINEREHHIKVLEKLLKDAQDLLLFDKKYNSEATVEDKEIIGTLIYAISSLKTDLKYDLMYEGEEIYTKTFVVAMLEELKTEIEELKNEPACCHHYKRGVDWSSNIIQQKINNLKGNEDGEY